MQEKAKEFFEKGMQLLYQKDKFEGFLKEAKLAFDEAYKIDPNDTKIFINKCICDYFCIRYINDKSNIDNDLKAIDNLIEKNVGLTKAYYLKALLLYQKNSEKNYYESIKSLEMNDEEGFFIKALSLDRLEYNSNAKAYEFLLNMDVSKNLHLYKILNSRISDENIDKKLELTEIIIKTYPSIDLGYKDKYYLLKRKNEKAKKPFDENDKTLLELVDKWINGEPKVKDKTGINVYKVKCELLKEYKLYEPALETADQWINFDPRDIYNYGHYKREILQSQLKDNKRWFKFLSDFILEIDIGKVDFFSQHNVSEFIKYSVDSFFSTLVNNWIENEKPFITKSIEAALGIAESDFSAFIEKLIKKQYTKMASIAQGCLFFSKKKFDEAQKCFEDEELNKSKRYYGYFSIYALTETLFAKGKFKEAWGVSEELNFCNTFGFGEDYKYDLKRIVSNNYKSLRLRVRDTVIKEIMTPKNRITKKEAQTKFEEAMSYSFSGKEQDFKKALSLLDEAIVIEPESAMPIFFKILMEYMESNNKTREMEGKLDQTICKDVSFLAAYYLKLFCIPEDSWSNNYNIRSYKETIEPLLIPNDQESYLILALINIQFKKDYEKEMLEHLNKCTDKKYAKKVLELKIAYYEGKNEKEQAEKLTEEFLKLYPTSLIGFAFHMRTLLKQEKINEGIDFVLSFKEQLKVEFTPSIKKILDDFIMQLGESSFKEKGFVQIFPEKTIVICDTIIDSEDKNMNLKQKYMNYKGCLLLSQKKIPEGLKVLESIFASKPEGKKESSAWWSNNFGSKKIEYNWIDIYIPNLYYAYCLNNNMKQAQCLFGKAFFFYSKNDSYYERYREYYGFIFKETFPKVFPVNETINKMKSHKIEPLTGEALALYEKAIKLLYSNLKPDEKATKQALEILQQAEKLSSSFIIQFQITRISQEFSKLIDSLFEKDPLYIASYFHLGMCLWGDKHNLEYYDLVQWMKPNDNDVEGNFEKAEFLFNCAKKNAEALKYYQKIPNKYYLSSVLNQGIIYAGEKQVEKAVEMYDLCNKLFPEYDISYHKKSYVVDAVEFSKLIPEWAKKFPKGENLKKRVQEYSDSKEPSENKVLIGVTYVTCFFNETYFTYNLFQEIEAAVYDINGFNVEKCKITSQNLLDFCEKILKDPNFKGSTSTLALAANIKGSILVSMKKYQEALVSFEAALETLKTYALYYCNKGEVLNLLGKPIQALPCFEKAYTNMKLNKISNFSKHTDLLNKYVKSTIERERKKVITSLIDSIEKHAINQEEVKEMGNKVRKLERKMTLTNVKIDEKDAAVLKDIEKVSEQIKENEKVVETLNKEKEVLLKSVAAKETTGGVVDIQVQMAQVENWKEKAVKANEEKEKLENQLKLIEEKVAILFKNFDKIEEEVKTVNNDVKNHTEKIENIKKVQEEEVKKVEKHEEALQEGGVYLKVEIKKKFAELERESTQLYAYCRTFYWTMLNYFSAYRSLSTDLIKGNQKESNNEQLFVTGMKKVAKFGAEIVKGVPFIGGVIGGLDSIIDSIYTKYKEKQMEYKIKVVNLIIQKKFTLEEDISLEVGKLSYEMALIRKDLILNENSEETKAYKRIWKWLQESFEKIENSIFPSLEVNKENGAQIALKDISGLLAYIYKNHESILSRPEVLSKQFENIIVYGALNTLILDGEKNSEDIKKSANETKQKTNNKVANQTKSGKKEQVTKVKSSKKCNLI